MSAPYAPEPPAAAPQMPQAAPPADTAPSVATRLARVTVWVGISALILAAVMAVVWVLIGNQRDILGRALMTIVLLILFAGGTVLESRLAPRRADWFVFVSMSAWILGLLAGAVLTWMPERVNLYAPTFLDVLGRAGTFFLIVLILVAAVVHVRLYVPAAARYRTAFTRAVMWVTLGLVAVLVLMLIVPLSMWDWIELADLYWRATVALAILIAVGTALIPLINVLFAPKAPRPVTGPAPGYGVAGHSAAGYGASGYGADGSGATGYGAAGYGSAGYGADGYGAGGYTAPGAATPEYAAAVSAPVAPNAPDAATAAPLYPAPETAAVAPAGAAVPTPEPAPVVAPAPGLTPEVAPEYAPAAESELLPWPTYVDAVTPLPMLPDGSPDWNAYYTGVPTPGAQVFYPTATTTAPVGEYTAEPVTAYPAGPQGESAAEGVTEPVAAPSMSEPAPESADAAEPAADVAVAEVSGDEATTEANADDDAESEGAEVADEAPDAADPGGTPDEAPDLDETVDRAPDNSK